MDTKAMVPTLLSSFGQCIAVGFITSSHPILTHITRTHPNAKRSANLRLRAL